VDALKSRMKNLRQLHRYRTSSIPVPPRKPTTKHKVVKQMPVPPPLGLPLDKADRLRHDGYVRELQKECKCVPPIKQVLF